MVSVALELDHLVDFVVDQGRDRILTALSVVHHVSGAAHIHVIIWGVNHAGTI